ncbi:MAG: hypothetical protein K9L68_03475 [Spirochaetales bacterium]|nr:hypothetical protein [Spirochaetales bacterium]
MNKVQHIDDGVSIRNILVSVSDKNGLPGFVSGILAAIPEVHFYSTGGTYKVIQEELSRNGKETVEEHLVSVSDYTGQPEMQGGLVKTLDFSIYLGLLSEPYNKAHKTDLERTNSVEFDMVVVNLYPFVQTVSKPGADIEDARSNIDIGGPSMLRASAKNYIRVTPVCDPADYETILRELEIQGGSLSLSTRFALAAKAFEHTAEYDAAVAGYFKQHNENTLSNYYLFGGNEA